MISARGASDSNWERPFWRRYSLRSEPRPEMDCCFSASAWFWESASCSVRQSFVDSLNCDSGCLILSRFCWRRGSQ